MLPAKLKYKRGFTDINALFFINSENEKITVFSPYTKIIKEFKKLKFLTHLMVQIELIILILYI